jgi:hypothetical protein
MSGIGRIPIGSTCAGLRSATLPSHAGRTCASGRSSPASRSAAARCRACSPAFPGCVLSCRLVGIIHGHEKSKGGKIENDRLIAVEQDAHRFADIKTLKDLGPKFLEELEDFFVNYHELDEKKYRTRGSGGPNAARRALKVALKASK